MLDIVTHMPASLTPTRRWTDDEDFDALTARALGASDEEVGRRLGRSAKAVHHRRMRLAQLDAPRAAAPAPSLGSDLARAAADVEAAEVAVDAAHQRFASVMAPYLRPVADALRLAGVCGTTGDDTDLQRDGHAWRLVEALVQLGIEIRLPA